MSSINKWPGKIFTHQGAVAARIKPDLELRRSVLTCMLWEGEFYEEGEAIAARIRRLVPLVDAEKVASLAIEAREQMKLRHAPLLLVREMARIPTHKALVAKTLAQVIQRPDELTEFLSLYWKDGKCPLSAQVKRGLAKAFNKFSSYSLAKYNRAREVKLRDVLFLCHAKPKDLEQEVVWKSLVDGTLASPDTWEVALSGGADKRATWVRLIEEDKLGGLAMLRNLRNMTEAGVPIETIRKGLAQMKTERILPFRFIAAAGHAPKLEPELERAMFQCLEGAERLPGKTLLLVDVSGSMFHPLSAKSDLKRADAACGLAMLLREICEEVDVSTFSTKIVTVPPRRGFALRDAIVSSQIHSATYLGAAVASLPPGFDRLIVITDEQSHDDVPNPRWEHSYMINVASAQHGVGYGAWTHIDGWSESVVGYIREFEKKV